LYSINYILKVVDNAIKQDGGWAKHSAQQCYIYTAALCVLIFKIGIEEN
jgi:hypothetical protein